MRGWVWCWLIVDGLFGWLIVDGLFGEKIYLDNELPFEADLQKDHDFLFPPPTDGITVAKKNNKKK